MNWATEDSMYHSDVFRFVRKLHNEHGPKLKYVVIRQKPDRMWHAYAEWTE